MIKKRIVQLLVYFLLPLFASFMIIVVSPNDTVTLAFMYIAVCTLLYFCIKWPTEL